ncbi:MAG: mechanosensitive ion channel family protein [Candidatus Pacearchaeota archaeon]
MVSPVELYNQIISNNTSNDFLTALAIFAGIFILLMLFDKYLVYVLKKGAQKTGTYWDDIIVDFLKGINWKFYLYLSLYLATLYLALPQQLDSVLGAIIIIFVAYYASVGLISIVQHGLERYKQEKEKQNKEMSTSMISVLKFFAKVAIWATALLMVLSNFGINVTPLIASLGVGGVAIAFALQAVLGDLFAAFAIYFDKPFREGDFIMVGSDMGTVRQVGIKTTRMNALGGEELVFSNSDLTSSRIQNYGKMQQRRIVFNFGVEYNTTSDQLKKVKKEAEKSIKEVSNASLDMVTFKEFGDSGLVFEAVYYVETGNYNEYMEIQEKINLKLKEKIEKLGVGFAFPTRTVHFFDHGKVKK